MKITPIGSTATPTVVENPGSTQPDRLARAKSIAAGETPIKIVPSDTPIDPLIKKTEDSLRTIKMKTNVSPDRPAEPIAEPVIEEKVADSAIVDAGDKVNEGIEDTKPLSPQLAAIARQRRALQVKERELNDKQRDFDAKVASSTANDSSALISRLKSEPMRVLAEHGVTYDKLTEDILSSQNNPDVVRLKTELDAVKTGIEKKLEDRDAQAEKAVVAEMRRQVDKLAKVDPNYEMIRETSSQADVVELIHRTWKSTGEILSEPEAMQLVEDELTKEALKIANIKKVQSRLQPAQAPQAATQQKQTLKTLTNRDTSTSPMSRRDRAVAAFFGTLKK